MSIRFKYHALPQSEKDDSSIKIADFGFAKRIDELAAKETACGTPGYVAPGKPNLTHPVPNESASHVVVGLSNS